MEGMEVFKDAEAAVKGRRRSEAVQQLNYLIQTKPKLASTWLKTAQLALTIGEKSIATKAAELFGSEVGRSVDNDVKRAGIYAEAGDLKKALKLIEPLTKRDVPVPSIYHLVGTVKAQTGDLLGARTNLSKALALSPQLGITWYTIATVTDFNEQTGVFTKLVEAEKSFKSQTDRNFALYSYALGKAYADRREYEQSEAMYQRGAKIFIQLKPFDIQADTQDVNAIIRNFNSNALDDIPTSKLDYDRPVAVLGLPRSGTTLLGQMLASHPVFKGSAESNALTGATMHLSAENRVDFPSFMKRHGDAQMAIDYMSQVYQHITEESFSGNGKVVDKTLSLNRSFGIFSKILPRSKAIYISRNAEDIAWSCYKTPFRANYSWSWHPETIATHIKNELRLIEHWKELFPERILHITYEDLVKKPEQTLTEVCGFLNIEYDKKMLAFHKNDQAVLTSSVGQVHKPINQNSVNLSANYPEFSKVFQKFYK